MYLLACRVSANITFDEAADFLGAGRMPQKRLGRDIHPALPRDFRDLYRPAIARRYPRSAYKLIVAVTPRRMACGREQGESNNEDQEQAVHGVLQPFDVTAQAVDRAATGFMFLPASWQDTMTHW